MTDIPEQLRTIREHLHTGALGQREVWEKWLDEAIDELDQLFRSKNALQVEIDRLRALDDTKWTEHLLERENLKAEVERLTSCLHAQESVPALYKEIKRLKGILDGTERREAEYLALVEKHATENEARRVQWEAAKREAEKWVHESGFRLGQAHKVLQERNDEVARLRGYTTRLLSENERLKAERHTTKRMLEDILNKHDPYGPGAAGQRKP